MKTIRKTRVRGRALQLKALRVVGDIHSLCPRPCLHPGGEGRERILAYRAVQALVKLDTERARLPPNCAKPVLGEIRGRQQCEERKPVAAQQADIEFEPLARWSGGAGIEQSVAGALRQYAVRCSMGFAIREEQTLRWPPLSIDPGQIAGRSLRVNDRHRPPLVSGKVPAIWKPLEGVAELPQHLPPRVGRPDGPDQLRGRAPARGISPKAMFQGVAGKQVVDGQAVAANPREVVGDTPHGVEG